MTTPALLTVLPPSRRLPQLEILARSAREAGHDAPVRAALVDDPLGEVVLPDGCERVALAGVPAAVEHALRLLCADGDELGRALTPWVVLGAASAPRVACSSRRRRG